MGKKRKTRQEKIIADLRRKITQESKPLNSQALETQKTSSDKETIKPTYSLDVLTVKTPLSFQKPTYQNYFIPDLVKTTIVTSSILIAELVLFFLLKIR